MALNPNRVPSPPDHIALEMGFLAVLAERALTDAATLETSQRFLREHLQPWLTLFCAALETNAREPFFVALAEATRQFIAEDVGQLSELSQLYPSGQLIELS